MHVLITGDSGGVSDLITIDFLITKLINFLNSLLSRSMKNYIEGIVAVYST